MSKESCKSTWIFIKIVHEQRIDMTEIDDVVNSIEEVISKLVSQVLNNHEIDFTKINISSNLINQKEEDCK